MGNINYNQWITGNDCCKNNCDGDCNCHKDVCDCENILLEISKLHTDDEILQDEIDELSGKVEVISATVDTKLDASAYTPVDLTDYATKQWVEDKGYITTVEPLKTINGESLIGEGNIVISGGSGSTVDAYTKAESDARFQPIGNYLSATALNGYATEQWVLDKHYVSDVDLEVDLSNYVTFEDMGDFVGDVYTKEEVNNLFVTKATFNTYINNLQEQINSLVQTISGCCSQTGETIYRWITMTNDYACSGTTKMTKEKQQSSTDGGITWTDTGSYRTGSTVIEQDSTDCGYVPSSNYKIRVTYQKGSSSPVESGQIECNSSTTITSGETNSITFPSYFTSVEFGNCIDTIGEHAFLSLGHIGSTAAISAVTVPSNITTLEHGAFKNSAASNYTLNEGLTTIGDMAFYSNNFISAITIPSTVTTFGSQPFVFCTGLTSVTILATTPPSASSGIFNRCSNLTAIYVPSGSVNAYKNATGWSGYSNIIRAIQ